MERNRSDDIIPTLETINLTHGDVRGVGRGRVLIKHIHICLDNIRYSSGWEH